MPCACGRCAIPVTLVDAAVPDVAFDVDLTAEDEEEDERAADNDGGSEADVVELETSPLFGVGGVDIAPSSKKSHNPR